MLNREIKQSNQEEGGGVPGVLPRKILKTKKAGEAISGHFVRTILPSVNEQLQRILLPFIVFSFLNINFIDRYAFSLGV